MCLQVVLIVLSPKWPSARKGVAAAHESANPLRALDGVSFLSRAATSAVLPFGRTGRIVSHHRLRRQGGWGIKTERPAFSDRSTLGQSQVVLSGPSVNVAMLSLISGSINELLTLSNNLSFSPTLTGIISLTRESPFVNFKYPYL